MSMTLEMRPQLVQELRLEQRLELRQMLAHDFMEFINIEDDNDQELLQESLPFLVLHEVSHPLHDEGYVTIPPLKPSRRLQECLDVSVYQQAEEVGIDKAAVLIGQQVLRHTEQQMIQAHIALVERVYRDMFQLEAVPFHNGFLARLQAELAVQQERGLDRAMYDRLTTIGKQIDEGVCQQLYRKNYGLHRDLIHAYKRVYRGTTVQLPKKGC